MESLQSALLELGNLDLSSKRRRTACAHQLTLGFQVGLARLSPALEYRGVAIGVHAALEGHIAAVDQ